jgi:hypothetical protein
MELSCANALALFAFFAAASEYAKLRRSLSGKLIIRPVAM